MSDGLERLLASIGGFPSDVPATDGVVRADIGRESRKGVPEVILADRKRTEDALAATRAFLDARGRAILSRCPETLIERLRADHADCEVTVYERSGVVIIK